MSEDQRVEERLGLSKFITASAYWMLEYIGTAEQGISIPEYQREYSWGIQQHLEPLLQDFAQGLYLLAEMPKQSTFLGTVIAIDDVELRRGQMELVGGASEFPTSVHTIVDGQQRLTTMALLASALHNQLLIARAGAPGANSPQWLVTQAGDSIGALQKAIYFWKGESTPDHLPMPRIVRSPADLWARLKGASKYQSPIASLLSDYAKFVVQGNFSDSFDPGAPISEEAATSPDGVMRARWSFLNESMADLRKDASDRPDFFEGLPDIDRVTESKLLQRALYETLIPEEVLDLVKVDSEVRYLLLLDLFARYLRFRVTVGVITAGAEDSAFDMFEALNTTGELLTAYETFRPIVQTDLGAQYSSSAERVVLDKVTAWLDSIGDPAEKRKATERLVITTSLAESGDKVGTHLGEQRRAMSTSYRRQSTPEGRRNMVSTLGAVADFTTQVWVDSPAVPPSLTDEGKLSLAVLVAAKHDITKAALSRYHARVSGGSTQTVAEFDSAARAVAAFFGLWRAYFGGTGGIDGKHRDWMRTRGSRSRFDAESSAWVDRGDVAASDLKAYLIGELFKAMDSPRDPRATFVEVASERPVYKHNQKLARFLLLAALDDAALGQDGELVRGVKNCSPQLRLDRWTDEETFTVEHVAPQDRDAAGWSSSDIYLAERHVDRVGNLTLLPSDANASLSNLGWKSKHLGYRLLSAKTDVEAEAIRKEARASRVDLPAGVKRSAKYHSILADLASREGQWNLEAIDSRSRLLMGLAWDRLLPWLQPG